MPAGPSRIIQDAFLAPVVNIVRRVEIYEQDAKTPWRQDLWNEWLVAGSVNADNESDERRSFECVLDNRNGDLDPGPGGLWYDKVFVVKYGIELNQEVRDPRVIIVEEDESIGEGLLLKQAMNDAGIRYVHYNPLASRMVDVEGFDVLVSIAKGYTKKLAFLTEAFNNGKSVMTFGTDYTSARMPLLVGATTSTLTPPTDPRIVTPTVIDDSLALGWNAWKLGTSSYRKINSVATGAQAVATTNDTANGTSIGIIRRISPSGSRWIHVNQNSFAESVFDNSEGLAATHKRMFGSFTSSAVTWLDTYEPLEEWVTSLGEFLSDSIADGDDYGDTIKVTGRDYTKRCKNSKLVAATMHLKTETIESVIRTHALNSNISKISLPVTNKFLAKDTTWEADTERWTIMKELATANNYDLYFDAFGYLRMKPFNDPLLTPATLVLTTGERGNLISRGARTSDGRLFNHVVAIGESSDSSTPPVWAEAKNDAPNSPSNIAEIGDRVQRISSPLITTPQQALDLARSILSVSALEEFELDFSAVPFPWIEPGEIVEMNDPESVYWGPSRYLISNLTFPLDLGAMSGKGKRVTNVG